MSLCPFFGRCGGCLFQDKAPADYFAMKKNVVIEALRHRGLTPPVDDVIAIPAGTRRRATFAAKNGVFGFNALKSHTIVPVTTCPVLTKNLEQLIKPLAELARTLHATGDVAVTDTPQGVDIVWKDKNPDLPLSKLETLTAFCQTHAVARFYYRDEPIYQPHPLPFPPGVFLQPSEEGQAVLTQRVLKGVEGCRRVLDLFCGQGTFTRPLHAAGLTVKGYDSTAESIAALVQSGIAAEVRDLFRNPLTPSELQDAEAVVLDPPRAGAEAQCRRLADSTVPRCVMVSCNPQTFARDAAILTAGGARLCSVTPVDQFIYSKHIEVVGIFLR